MYRQQRDAGAGAQQQQYLDPQQGAGAQQQQYVDQQQGAGSPSLQSAYFSTSDQYPLDPSLQANGPQLLRPAPLPGHGRGMPIETTTGASDMAPPSSTTSPRFSSARLAKTSTPEYKPSDRSLPSKEVTEDTLEDAYVSFIFYCNPNFELSTSTAELRKTFQNPPKSDNKDFATDRLWELIQKFDAKEIKTWGQLALDLGVEPPDPDKGQSVQKVQQYSVRLKRWMRAMHLDAFFEYLLDKQHAYFTDVPPPSDPFPASGRDGVQAEEDLAIRALDPSFRPKRGRRRNEEIDADAGLVVKNDGGPPRKKQLLTTSFSFEGHTLYAQPQSAMPQSAIPLDDMDPWAAASAVTPQSFAPWGMPKTANDSHAPSHLRWQLHGSSQMPSTPHPMTAHPSSGSHLDTVFDREPQLAITPSSRKRRKHGPAVSSAWRSTADAGAKLRGRPPASRQVQDGPFNTFPADPRNDKSPESAPRSTTSLVLERTPSSGIPPSPMPPPAQPVAPVAPAQGRQRLSLQMPRHVGGEVKMVTPTVLVNGESNARVSSDDLSGRPSPVHGPLLVSEHPRQRVLANTQENEGDMPEFAFEVLKRALASELIRGDLIGRRNRLSTDEAKRLADAVLVRLNVPRQDTENRADDIARLTAASWLGLGGQLNVPLGPTTSGSKRVFVARLRTDPEGYEEMVSPSGPASQNDREVFEIYWTTNLFGLTGSFELKGLSIDATGHAELDDHDRILQEALIVSRGIGHSNPEQRRELLKRGLEAIDRRGGGAGDDGIDWKAKYMGFEFAASVARGEVLRLKGRILDAVL